MDMFALLLVCVYVSAFVGPTLGFWRRRCIRSSIELDTPNRYVYIGLEEFGIVASPRKTFFKFQVRTTNDAHVALLQSAGDTEKNIYEIVIGGFRNSRSLIRNKRLGDLLAETEHDPLDPSAFRDFWISWEGGVVSVGTGRVIGAGQFMTWTDPDPHKVNYISVSTGFGATGSWRFEEILRTPTIGFSTGSNYIYQSVPKLNLNRRYKKNFVFSVMAANDAHIALLSNEGDTDKDMYELVIGGWGNTRSVIREEKQGAILAEAFHTPLCADQHLPFWISINGGTISVGYGNDVGSRRFMSWTDVTPTRVRFVSVATAFRATGHWLFSEYMQ